MNMTKYQLRIKCAEALEYTLYSEQRGEYLLQYAFQKGKKEPWKDRRNWESEAHRYKVISWSEFDSGRWDGRLPDFPNSHDACQRLRDALTPEERSAFGVELALQVACPTADSGEEWFQISNATAEQICKAFIAAKGL